MFSFNRIFLNVANRINADIDLACKRHISKLDLFKDEALKLRDVFAGKSDLIDLSDLWIETDRHIDILRDLVGKHLYPEFKLAPLVDSLTDEFGSSLSNLSEKEAVWFILGFKIRRISELESSGNFKEFLHNQFHHDTYEHVFKINKLLKNYFENIFLYKFMGLAESILNRKVAFEAEHFSKIHKRFEKFQDEIMFFDQFSQTVSGKKIDKKAVLEKLEEYVSVFSEIYGQIEKEKNEISVSLIHAVEKAQKKTVSKAYTLNSPVFRLICFSDKAAKKKKRDVTEKFLHNDKLFENHFIIEKGDWKKDLAISKYQIFTGNLTVETIELSEKKFIERYKPVFSKISETLQNTVDIISKLKPEEFQKTKITILKESRSILKAIRADYVPDIIETAQKGSILSVIRSFSNRIGDEIGNIDSTHSVFRSREIVKNATVSKSIEIPLRELVSYKLDFSLAKELSKFIDHIRKINEKVVRKTGEIDKIVEYNIDAALSVMRNRPDTDEESAAKAVTIATEGLERAIKLSEELSVTIGNVTDEVKKTLPEMISRYLNELEELTFAEKLIELNIYLVRKRTVRNVKEWFFRIKSFSKKTFPELLELVREYFYGAKKNYSKLKKIAGLSQEKEGMGFFYLNTLNEIEKKIQGMPYVYQRLFSHDSLPDRNFYISRPDVYSKLLEDFTYWKNGGAVSTVLFAEKGNGKTTFIEIAQTDIFKEHKVLRAELTETVSENAQLLAVLKDAFEMPEVASIEELENMIMANETRKIFFLENFQNMYLRSMDGFEAIERFLLFMERTQRKVLFIVSCNLYAWNYIDLVTSASRYFQRTVLIKSLSTLETEDLIMKRHNSSGYDINFETPEEIGVVRKTAKMKNRDDQQNYLRKHYFEKLTKLSAGNIRSSILMWLGSVREMTSESMSVSSDLLTDYPFISDFPKEELFVLTSVIMHDALDMKDYALVSRENENESHAMLLRLYNKGLLVKKEDSFQIHPFVYRDVVRVLKSLNMLH